MEKIYTLEEAAHILKVSTRTMKRYIAAKRLKATKIGQWRVSESALRNFLGLPENTKRKKYGSRRKKK